MINTGSVQFAVYEESGRILSIGSAPEQYVAMQAPLTLICDPDVLDTTHHVLDEQCVERQPLTATWDTQVITGNDEATLSGLPIPCTVHVDDVPVVVDDGTFEFSATLGDYAIVVDEVAYLRQEWIINAN